MDDLIIAFDNQAIYALIITTYSRLTFIWDRENG